MNYEYCIMLDDMRVPKDVDTYIKLKPKFSSYPWIVVRNYADFVSYIEEHGLPDLVALDHDLSAEHYTPPEFWNDYEASKKWQEENEKNHTEPTGAGAAKWLVEYCKKHEWADLPDYVIISLNPVGASNMKHILEDYIGERLLNKKSLMENQ